VAGLEILSLFSECIDFDVTELVDVFALGVKFYGFKSHRQLCIDFDVTELVDVLD
jgi:hypothetical protein